MQRAAKQAARPAKTARSKGHNAVRNEGPFITLEGHPDLDLLLYGSRQRQSLSCALRWLRKNRRMCRAPVRPTCSMMRREFLPMADIVGNKGLGSVEQISGDRGLLHPKQGVCNAGCRV